MSPPSYPDLGKNAKDVFSKGYNFGLVKLDVKSETASGVEINIGGTSNQESGKVFGFLQTKYKVKEYGLSLSEKWNTDNILCTEVSVQDQLLQGLKLTGSFDLSPESGIKSSKIMAAYLNDFMALNGDVNFDSNGSILQGSAVFGYQGLLAGYQTGYDTNNEQLTKNNFALGFSIGDFIFHTNVDLKTESNAGQEFGGSIFQKVCQGLETGIQLAWSSSGNNTRFGIAAKYDLNKDASIRVKINNSSQLGFGYQQRIPDDRLGITLTLSAIIDGNNLNNNGNHKVGFGLELEA